MLMGAVKEHFMEEIEEKSGRPVITSKNASELVK